MKGKIFLSSIALAAFFLQHILLSQSGWLQQISGITHGLKSIFCLNENTAWVLGSAGRDATNFSSGVYYYSLQTQEFTQTKK